MATKETEGLVSDPLMSQKIPSAYLIADETGSGRCPTSSPDRASRKFRPGCGLAPSAAPLRRILGTRTAARATMTTTAMRPVLVERRLRNDLRPGWRGSG